MFLLHVQGINYTVFLIKNLYYKNMRLNTAQNLRTCYELNTLESKERQRTFTLESSKNYRNNFSRLMFVFRFVSFVHVQLCFLIFFRVFFIINYYIIFLPARVAAIFASGCQFVRMENNKYPIIIQI